MEEELLKRSSDQALAITLQMSPAQATIYIICHSEDETTSKV